MLLVPLTHQWHVLVPKRREPNKRLQENAHIFVASNMSGGKEGLKMCMFNWEKKKKN